MEGGAAEQPGKDDRNDTGEETHSMHIPGEEEHPGADGCLGEVEDSLEEGSVTGVRFNRLNRGLRGKHYAILR